jgi:surfeit locus 1 family protein
MGKNASFAMDKPRPAVALAALGIFCVLIGLGFWQVQRLSWKTALISGIERNMAAPPVDLLRAISEGQDIEFRPVRFTAQPLGKKHFLLRPRVKNGQVGVHVIVPVRIGGRLAFVNEGWMAQDAVKASTVQCNLSAVATLPRKGYFTPENKPEADTWYWADVQAMAARMNMHDPLPYILNLPAVGISPDLPNNHKSYAAFWFSMAVVFAVIFFLAHRRRIP